jgi:hypothetical protein
MPGAAKLTNPASKRRKTLWKSSRKGLEKRGPEEEGGAEGSREKEGKKPRGKDSRVGKGGEG